MCKFKVYKVMILYTYCKMITTVGLVNTSITPHNYNFSFVVRKFKIDSLRNFQVHNKVLSERGEWKVGLKLNIQKPQIMTSRPIISWQINGETVETVRDFIFLGSKITADGDWSHEIKRHLLFGRKVMTNLDSILKSRDITLSTKVHLVKAMVFQWSCMDVRVGLSYKKSWVPKN